MFQRWGVAVALFIHASAVAWIGWGACPSKVEVGHMAAAVYFWRTLRFDVFHVNPPLTRIISGLPVVQCGPNYDWDFYSSRPQDRPEWGMGTAFVAANSPENVRWYFAIARWALIPLLIVGGYFGYRLSREVYGPAAGLVFLALWCVDPLLLGEGATMCPDAAAAALGLVAVDTLRTWLRNPNWPRAVAAGACLGLLPLAKLTWIIAFGLWPLIWCLWALPIYLAKADTRSLPLPPFRQLAAIVFLGLYALNMGYLFDGTCRPLGRCVFHSELLRGQEVSGTQEPPAVENRFAGTWVGKVPVPLPADFVQGMDTQRYDLERGVPSYLRGQWSDHGWWYYYLYALTIKEPLGTWCVLALAVGATIFRRGYSASWRDETLVLAPGLAVLIFVSSQTGFSLHLRYILPALPFLFVWISKVGRVFEICPFTGKRRVTAVAVSLALTWSIGSSLSIFPHSVSYFNVLAAVLPTPVDGSYPKPITRNEENRGILSMIHCAISAGPRNGPRHLLDSNIDSGQDLFYLEDWCESHPEARPIRVAYFGGYPLDRSTVTSAGSPPVGCETEELVDRTNPATFGPMPGWYALSVNEIYGRSRQYRYFLHFEPVAVAGYSIYVYHIKMDEANRVRREFGMPELRISAKETRE
ncbi:MAG: hypothetical protein ACLQNE_13740 [Thermoguttaceae bacterium]